MFKKYIPNAETIKQQKALRLLGNRIHNPTLWHWNRRSVSMAFAIGLFCAWLPIPFQTVVAAALAIFLRANLPISVVLVFITNPFTMAPLFYFAYIAGAWILQQPIEQVEFEISWDWLMTTLLQIWQPFLLGCFSLAIISAILGYILVRLLWRIHIIQKYNQRKK